MELSRLPVQLVFRLCGEAVIRLETFVGARIGRQVGARVAQHVAEAGAA